MSTIAAIPTEYKGYCFRSRLEARWAVFFDICGMRWEYESEGFSLGYGRGYLPDFLLYDVETVHAGGSKKLPKLWVEVKGELTKEDAKKILEFSGFDEANPERGVPNPIYVIEGFPDGDTIGDIDEFLEERAYGHCVGHIEPFSFLTVDGDSFMAYPGLNHDFRFELFGADSGYMLDRQDDATLGAFRIARQARFDHGETPTYQRIKSVRNYFLMGYTW